MATDTRGGRKTAAALERGVAREPAADSARRPSVGAARPTARRRAGAAVTLTGRGGLVVVFGLTLLGATVDGLFSVRAAQGVLFVVGCLLAAIATRRTDLLILVVSPPLLFFLVSVLAAVTGSLGERSFLFSVLVTVATTLTSNVPWLFFGTVLAVLVTVPRGLPAALRELSARVTADNPFRGRATLRGRKEADDDPVRWDETPGRRARPPKPEPSPEERPAAEA